MSEGISVLWFHMNHEEHFIYFGLSLFSILHTYLHFHSPTSKHLRPFKTVVKRKFRDKDS